MSEYTLQVSLPDFLSPFTMFLVSFPDLQIPTDCDYKIYGFLSHSHTPNLIPRLLSTCHVHHKLCTIDQENMLPPFLDAMRDNAEGTPADIQEPTDDSAFEKRSRELVTLYRYTPLTHPVSDHILTPSHSHTLTPSHSYPHTLISHTFTSSHPHLSYLHTLTLSQGI